MARVLIVEDDKYLRQVLRQQIMDRGHEVAGEAINGEEAVSKYRILRPDLVLMDVAMPKFKGIKALKQILSADPGAKVIMCSALGQEVVVC